MNGVKKVMFVCLGNICRSPMAEACFRHVVNGNGLSDSFKIDSSGTSHYHIGESPDPRMGMTAEKHGVEMSHQAQQLTREDLEEFDYIIVMDKDNYASVMSLSQNARLREKVHYLREYDPQLETFASEAVPDPYYGGKEGFENVFQICMRSAKELLKRIE